MNRTKGTTSRILGGLRRITKIKEFGILVALLGLCIILMALSPYFLKATNLFNVLRQISIYSILAVGQALVIIIGCLDLSIGTVMGLMGVLCALLSVAGIPPVLVLLLVLVAGGFMGMLNGLLVTKVGVNAFIVTLGMQYIARAISLLLTGGMPIWLESDLAVLGGGYIGPVPVPVIIMVFIAALGIVFTKKTLPGRNIYAVGSNEQAAKLSGVRIDRIKIMAFMIMGVLAGLSGIILAGTLKTAEPTAGLGYELEAIAAVIIGGTSLSGGEGTILGVIIGAALMGVLKNGFVLLNVSAYWQVFAIGFVIIAAVSIDSIKNKRANK